jgi:hypothetical protein
LPRRGSVATVSEEFSHDFDAHGSQRSAHRLY